MSAQGSTKNTQERNHQKQRLTPNGTLFEFLASPADAGAVICLIRVTLPPGVAVPLHSHPRRYVQSRRKASPRRQPHLRPAACPLVPPPQPRPPAPPLPRPPHPSP